MDCLLNGLKVGDKAMYISTTNCVILPEPVLILEIADKGSGNVLVRSLIDDNEIWVYGCLLSTVDEARSFVSFLKQRILAIDLIVSLCK